MTPSAGIPTLLFALLLLPACARNQDAVTSQRLALSAAIPEAFPEGTRLRLGDPVVQKQLEQSGYASELPFIAEWQNISGGPYTLEAFRAKALDGGAVGDTPPIHAAFTGLDIKIIAVQRREKPIVALAIAPGSQLTTTADLRGKKIAYAPGQAQGALILRALKHAGLSPSDVQLVELTSYEFKDALASRQVDVAPLSGTGLLRYLEQNREQGASSIPIGVDEGISFFYVRTEVLEDPARAAALREYVELRTKAQLWAAAHAEPWIEAYYVKDQGLTPEQARYVALAGGKTLFPADWGDVIAETQQTIDLLVEAAGRPRFEATSIFDLRFQHVASEVADAVARGQEKLLD
jgi:sulfonate transport system substrate-binding protein